MVKQFKETQMEGRRLLHLGIAACMLMLVMVICHAEPVFAKNFEMDLDANKVTYTLNSVLVEGKLYKKNEVVKTIRTDIEGVASTSADLLPYGNFRIVESEAPDGYLTDGAKPIDFTITENGKIVDLTDEAHSIYNQIKRGDIKGVKIGAGTHKRLADVPFRITSKTTGENHVVVTDDNGQFSTSADWASHKHNTNAGKTSEDGVWFGTSEPDDSKGALPYDTYIIEEMRCETDIS